MDLYVGVDLGGTAIKSGLIDESGNILKTLEIPTGVEANSSAVVMQNIKDSIKQILNNCKKEDVKAIGIGVPGIAGENGNITIFANIRVFDNYPMGLEVEKEFKIPVFVDNDANNAARGEYVFGVAKGKKNFVLVTLGTGIGGGIFINGDIYQGIGGCAGEVGHMIIVPNGRQCGCGNFGCWETYGSASAMIKRANALISKGLKTSLIKYYPDKMNAKVITEEAEKGDPIAMQIFDETAYYVGLGIANIIQIFNPELCVIGGGLSHAGKFLLDKVRFHAMLASISSAWSSVGIVTAKLGNKAGILGAGALAFMRINKEGKV